MHPTLMKNAILLISLAGLATVSSSRAAVLSVDFGRLDAGSHLTEPGFSTFEVTGTNRDPGVTETATFGAYTVSVFPANVDAGNRGVSGRDRAAPLDTGSFVYGDLLRDLVTRINQGNTSGSPLESLRISGLTPLTTYSLQLWAIDVGSGADNEVSEWYDMSSGSNVLLGTITNDTTSPVMTSNNNFSFVANVTSNALGQLQIGSVFPTSQGQMNGFVLSEVVPEPASATFAGLGLLGLMLRRRR